MDKLPLALSALLIASIGGRASASTYNLSLSGNVANFQNGYLPLSGLSPITVADGDTLNLNVTLDQSYTIPASQQYTSILLYLSGDGFDGTPTGTVGTYTFYDGAQEVATYAENAGTANQLATDTAVFPPNNTALTFTSFTDDFVITALDTPVTVNAAAFNYQLASFSAAPEPSAWVMMILGAGLAGAGLRRSRYRHAHA